MMFLDRDSKSARIDNRRLTAPNIATTMDNDDLDDDVGKTYCSLPNIVPHSEHSSDNSSRHSLRAKPSDTLDRDLIKVTAVSCN